MISSLVAQHLTLVDVARIAMLCACAWTVVVIIAARVTGK